MSRPADSSHSDAVAEPGRALDSAGAASALMALVKRLLSGAAVDRGAVEVCSIPASLTAVGCPAGKLMISEKIVDKALYDHHVPASVFANLPDLIANPAMVFESDTVLGSFVVVTTAAMGHRPVMVMVKPGSGRTIEISWISTMLGKDNPKKILDWIDQGLLLSFDKQKSLAVMTESRLCIPTTVKLQRGGRIVTVAFDSGNFAVEAAAAQTDPSPTPEQAESGNYAKGRVKIGPLPVVIENPYGSNRVKVDRNGKQWRSRMAAHYGYIAGTVGSDGDEVDCFVGPEPDSPYAFVINQGFGGKHDEHKLMLGFRNEAAARAAYLSSYDPGWQGLSSIVPASLDSIRKWLRNGDMSRPATAADFSEQRSNTMNKVLWDSAALPIGSNIPAVLYSLRLDDAGSDMLLEPLTGDELDLALGLSEVAAMDGIVATKATLNRKMTQLMNILAASSTEDVRPTGFTISEPKLRKIYGPTATVNVDVQFALADGQTITIAFHNPDSTPTKLLPQDELISWKWLLNKRDVTIVVAPERGAELNPREVARRIAKIAARNHAAFIKAIAGKAERDARVSALEQEDASLDKELSDLTRDIEVAKIELEDAVAAAGARAASAPAFDPASAEGYATIAGDEAALLKYQDVLDPAFNARVVEVRNALRELGWTGQTGARQMSKDSADGERHTVEHVPMNVGAGANVVGVTWSIDGGINQIVDDLKLSPSELAGSIDSAIVAAVPERSGLDPRIGTLMRDGKTVYYATVDGQYMEHEDLSAIESELRLREIGSAAEVPAAPSASEARTADPNVTPAEARSGAAVVEAEPQAAAATASGHPETRGGIRKYREAWEAGIAGNTERSMRATDGFGKLILAVFGSYTASASAVYGALRDELFYGDMPDYTFESALDRIVKVAKSYAEILRNLSPPEVKVSGNGKTNYRKAVDELDKIVAYDIDSSMIRGLYTLIDALFMNEGDIGLSVAQRDARDRFDLAREGLFAGLQEQIKAEKDSAEESALAEYSKFDASALKMPTAVQLLLNKPKTIGLVSFEGESGWTNGHLIDLVGRPKLVTDAISKYFGSESSPDLRTISPDAVNRIFTKAKAEATTPVDPTAFHEWTSRDIKAQKDLKFSAVVLTNEGAAVAVEVARPYLAYFVKTYKAVDFFASGPDSPVIVRKAGKIAGIIMPMRSNAEASLRRALRAARAAPAPAALSPVEQVNAAYAFADATDEFKAALASSVTVADYSMFATAKAVDLAAIANGATVSWGFNRALDSATLDGIFSSKIEFGPQSNSNTGGIKSIGYVQWRGVSVGLPFEVATSADHAEFGAGTFRFNEPGRPSHGSIFKIDPTKMMIYFLDHEHYANTEEVKWLRPVSIQKLRVFNQYDFAQAYGKASMDAVANPGLKPASEGSHEDTPSLAHSLSPNSTRSEARSNAPATARNQDESKQEDPDKLDAAVPKDSPVQLHSDNPGLTPSEARSGMAREAGGAAMDAAEPVATPSEAHSDNPNLTPSESRVEEDAPESPDQISLFDAAGEPDYVGVIRKDGAIKGRIDIRDDGKAITYIGATGARRVMMANGYEVSSMVDPTAQIEDLLTLPINDVAQMPAAAEVEPAQVLKHFIGASQMAAVKSAMRGEERQHFVDKLAELAQLVSDMPKVYDQDGKGDEAIVYLHYFRGGSDWYITERDTSDEQLQAYGYAILNGDTQNAEMGYVSIKELIEAGVELDFYFDPKPLKVFKSRAASMVETRYAIIRADNNIDSTYPTLEAMKGALDELDRRGDLSFWGRDEKSNVLYLSFAAETRILKADGRPSGEALKSAIDAAMRWAERDVGQYGVAWKLMNVPRYMAAINGVELAYASEAVKRYTAGDADVGPQEPAPVPAAVADGPITDEQYAMMEDILANDENSDDQEIAETMIGNGVSAETAARALAHRGYFLTTPVPPAGILKDLMNGGSVPQPAPAAERSQRDIDLAFLNAVAAGTESFDAPDLAERLEAAYLRNPGDAEVEAATAAAAAAYEAHVVAGARAALAGA